MHQLKGIKLLLDHYKVPEGDICERLITLVIRLGMVHVPYFLPPKRPGAKIDYHNYLKLALDVQQARKPGDRGDMPALKRLLAGNGYKQYARAKGGEETLRKRLQRARKDPLVSSLIERAQIPENSRQQLLATVSRPGRMG